MFPLLPGDWKYSLKPDEKPPKSLFDQFWEWFGKFLKSVGPILAAVGVLYLGYSLGNGEWPPSWLEQLELPALQSEDSGGEIIYPVPENPSSGNSDNAPVEVLNGGSTGGKLAIFVMSAVSESEASYELQRLRELRLDASIVSNGPSSGISVFIKKNINRNRVEKILAELRKNGFSQATITYL